MIEQINTELLKLQEELSKFDGAISQISKSSEISDQLISSSKELQKSFGEKLEIIEGLFSDYMNKTYNHTEDKLNNIFHKFQERLSQEEASLEKFSNLTMQNESLTQEFLQKISENSKEQIDKLISETSNTLNEEKDFIKLQISTIKSDIDKLIQEHNSSLKKEQELLDNYLELANETAQLSVTLKNVDFPKRLDTISEQIDEVKKAQNNNAQKVDKINETSTKILNKTTTLVEDQTTKKTLDKVTKIANDTRSQHTLELVSKVNKKAKTTRFFVVLTFILIIIFIAFFTFAFLTFFPHFFEDLIS
ncbi:MAG: hypothetical protein JXR68_09910 [Bacteroidales bacterium]|nr:hypothetical protein [Bacteroidales bacterium]